MTAQDEGSVNLPAAVQLADSLLSLVHANAPTGISSYHRNEQLLGLTFARAFRCFRSIRNVVAIHADADDALILTRALLSMVIRSLWLVAPGDKQERDDRSSRAVLDWYALTLRQHEELRSFALPVDHDEQHLREKIDELRSAGVRRLPSERDMAVELRMGELYARIYRSASDVAHYSVFTAMESFEREGYEGSSLDGVGIRFDQGQPVRAESALLYAALVYAGFLEACDDVVKHGIADEARRLVEDYASKRPKQNYEVTEGDSSSTSTATMGARGTSGLGRRARRATASYSSQ